MKTSNLLTIMSVCAAVALSACTLESEVYDKINADLYPSSARDAKDLVTGAVYGGFQNNDYDGAFNVATGFHLSNDMSTDYGHCSWGGVAWEGLQWANFDKSQTRNVTQGWGYLNWISKMTLTIDRIESIQNIDPDLKARYIAECKCGRGFMAYLIWDRYGPIVVADLETLKDPLAEIILPRLSEEETREFIETNLKEAAAVLPATLSKGDPDYGRFTAGLAHTLLMKFYMHTKQWGKAIAEGRELAKPAYGYALVTDKGDELSAYSNIFTAANEGNAETIWAVNCMDGYQSHLWFPHALPGGFKSTVLGNYGSGWGGYKMLWDFYQTFETGDQRTLVIADAAGNVQPTAPIHDSQGQDCVLPVKYKVENLVGDNCNTDWIVYRYADVLTLLAEAIVHEGNAVTQEAVELLNQVRTRAGLAAYTLGDFTDADNFIDKLLWERAHELWFEGTRREDLIRNNKFVSTMSEKCKNHGRTDVITGKGEKFHVFPLPESAIIEGQGKVVQNEGY